MSTSTLNTSNRKEMERAKLIQEKCQTLLSQMLRDEDNKYCVDCDAKGPRWASWNLGVFLCIRCAGIHRNLGVHISRVKSVNLDAWTPEQVISLQHMGNSRARAVYEAQLPDGFRRPQTDTALESFIRAKYEHKKYLAREWVQSSPPKVDWAKEIDEELERQKRKKKAVQANVSLGVLNCGSITTSSINRDDKKTSTLIKSVHLPAPLPKPKNHNSPKNPRNTGESNDLLGLSSPTKSAQNSSANVSNSISCTEQNKDTFSCFLSSTPTSIETESTTINNCNSLAKEEEDFFNQIPLNDGFSNGRTSGKLTKDSIMALYAQTSATGMGYLSQQQQQQQQSLMGSQSTLFGVTGPVFTGLTPGNYMGAGGPNSVQPQQQFMTPPNSVSMYNTPVMTAPAAFTTPNLASIHIGPSNIGFTGQFPTQIANFPQTQNMSGGLGHGSHSTANILNSNSMMFPGLMGMSGAPTPPFNSSLMTGFSPNPVGHGNTIATAASTPNLQKQFGNLNLGNVWQ